MRMGIDKTLLPVDGETLVARVVEAVSPVFEHVLIVTNRPEALADAGLAADVPIVSDDTPYLGPLGGVATALAHAPDEWVLAVAADMPWVRPDVLRALWDARGDGQVVVLVTPKGPEPLLAFYHRSVLPIAQRILESGRRRLVAIFPEARVVEVPVETLHAIDPQLRSLVNVNTPEDLADVRETPPPEPPQPPSVIELASRRLRGAPSERPITVFMNDVEIATMQASPRDLEELAVGFLVAEGLLSDRDALETVDSDYKRGLVYVASREPVPEDFTYRTRYVTSGCGQGVTFSSVGHARGLEPVRSDLVVESEQLYAMMGQMARGAEMYRDTGGTHACALGRAGEVVLLREDVGRHNAVDKLLGRAWLDRVPVADAVLLTTGRISYEMAVKAAKARVPVVVSRTAVTDLAVEVASELGITVVGYARGGKLVIYTHPHRVRVVTEEA